MSNIFVCLSASIACGDSINQIVDYIGKNNHTLIYGGGKRGAMGQLSSKLHKNYPQIPQKVYTIPAYRHDVPDYSNTIEVCDNLLYRLQALITSSDVAVVYPGGLGTAQELMTLLEWSRAVKHIPIVVINENGHYDWLVNLFDSWNYQGYTDKHINNFCMVVTDFKDATEFIDSICQ